MASRTPASTWGSVIDATSARRSGSTRRPAVAAASRTDRPAGESPATRTSTTSRSVLGRWSPAVSPRPRRSPRRRTDCRPTGRGPSRRGQASAGAPRIASSWAPPRSGRTGSTRSARPAAAAPSRPARPGSGCPRARSSVRIVATIASRSARRLRARNASRSRVDGSAQWMSSMTSRTRGRVAEPPEQTEEPLEDPALEPVCPRERRRVGLRSVGQLGDEPGELGRRRPDRIMQLALAGPDRPATGGPRRSARTAGRSRRAGRSRPQGRAWCAARRARGRRRRTAVRRIRGHELGDQRLLPIPASPSTSDRPTAGRSAAASTAASSSASSARRPTKTGLVTRPDIGSMVAPTLPGRSPAVRDSNGLLSGPERLRAGSKEAADVVRESEHRRAPGYLDRPMCRALPPPTVVSPRRTHRQNRTKADDMDPTTRLLMAQLQMAERHREAELGRLAGAAGAASDASSVARSRRVPPVPAMTTSKEAA